MTTATDQAIRDHQERQDADGLNSMVRNFTKRFEPEERRDRLDFEMELHQLVRAIYREAAKPYEKILSAGFMHSQHLAAQTLFVKESKV